MTVQLVNDSIAHEAVIIEGLSIGLAETMVVTAKAQTYHWNVTGMSFGALHDLFEEIYTDHFAAQDTLAERIKALGGHADGRLSHAISASAVKECDGAIGAREMVARMAENQKTLSATMLDIARVADDKGDLVTHDMAIARADAHDKFAWILDAHLSE